MNLRLVGISTFATMLTLSIGCARSPTGGLDEETQAQLDQASEGSAEALAENEAQGTAIEELDNRVTAIETDTTTDESIADLSTDVAAVGDEVTAIEEELAALDVRVDMVEAMWPPNDDEVLVDDKAAAGFPDAAPVDTVEDGLSYLNQLANLHDGQIDDLGLDVGELASEVDSIEVAYSANLETTVTNYIDTLVQEGAITVEVDLSYDPLPDVDPRDNALGVVEYSAATDLDDAIRALRYSNQVRFTPPAANTQLGALARNYVQEAIETLDGDLYDVIHGNIVVELADGSTVGGVEIAEYISTVVQNDTVLLEQIFESPYFQDAVTTVVVDGNAPVSAENVVVDPTNLGDPADFLNAQVSIETLYDADLALGAAIDGTIDDADALAVDVAAVEDAIAAVIAGENPVVTNLATLDAAITALEDALAVLSAGEVSFDNTNHAPFDNNNDTDTVQVAIEDLHERLVALGTAVTNITVNGTASDASIITYTDPGNVATTVEAYLDFLTTQIVAGQVVLQNGNYIAAGQDLNVGVQALDTALGDLADDVAALTDLVEDDLLPRVVALEATVAQHTTQIAANTAAIAANAAAIAANAADVADLEQDVGALATTVGQHTTQIAANAAAAAANAADIADHEARLVALEDFNANELADLIEAIVDQRVAAIQAQVDDLAETAGKAYILGVSAQTSDGRFSFGGQTGVNAATAMCQATFPNDATAHLCTPSETHEAVALGNIGNTNIDAVNTWTVTGLTRVHTTELTHNATANSLVTSCNNLLYNSGDVATGTRLRVDLDMPSFGTGGQNIAGDAVIVQPNRACTEAYAVLCCR